MQTSPAVQVSGVQACPQLFVDPLQHGPCVVTQMGANLLVQSRFVLHVLPHAIGAPQVVADTGGSHTWFDGQSVVL
jgi:hypothetical protein